MSETRDVRLKVFRFNSESDYLPAYKTYDMTVGKDELILDLLNRIKWEHDGSFSYRRSCRHGICGACAIKVNSKPVLSCKQNAMELLDIYGDELVFEPQDKKRAVKDMIIDKGDFWEKHSAIKPYLIADIDKNPTKENIVKPELVQKLLDADYCIQCGSCHYACPALEVNEDYLGPAALASAFRFASDVRDEATKDRLEITFEGGSGVWDCVKCYECADACPKDVNPIEKITKLHNMQFEEGVAKSNVATRHAEGFARSIKKHGFLDEADIVKYSEGPIGVLKHLPEALKMMKSGKIHFSDNLPWVDNVPKSKNLDEIQKLVEISQTNKL
jgi:succinate dehydrogenase / fumarate reductase iron-sulfur subunit